MKTSTKIWMCLGGIALVALGVLCIIYPGSTIVSLAWAFGLMLIVSGCSTFGVWATLRRINPFSGLTFLAGILQVLLGIVLIINPAPLAVALPFIFAFWVMYEGINLLMDSFNYKRLGWKRWWVLCLLGVLIICAGFYGMFYDPAASAKTIAWLVGLGIIFDGIGYWAKVAAINHVEKKLNNIAKHINQVIDIEDVEEIK
ncbi:MAG: DUF308 domain-containing protein [Paludibacteraceae bacterium]|nr:DUF308 domain-containing protein [Paludibacteraceae bacterium]